VAMVDAGVFGLFMMYIVGRVGNESIDGEEVRRG